MNLDPDPAFWQFWSGSKVMPHSSPAPPPPGRAMEGEEGTGRPFFCPSSKFSFHYFCLKTLPDPTGPVWCGLIQRAEAGPGLPVRLEAVILPVGEACPLGSSLSISTAVHLHLLHTYGAQAIIVTYSGVTPPPTIPDKYFIVRFCILLYLSSTLVPVWKCLNQKWKFIS